MPKRKTEDLKAKLKGALQDVVRYGGVGDEVLYTSFNRAFVQNGRWDYTRDGRPSFRAEGRTQISQQAQVWLGELTGCEDEAWSIVYNHRVPRDLDKRNLPGTYVYEFRFALRARWAGRHPVMLHMQGAAWLNHDGSIVYLQMNQQTHTL